MPNNHRKALSGARQGRRPRARIGGFVLAATLAVTTVGCATDTAPTGGGSDQVLTYGLSAEPTDIKTGVDQGSAAKEVTALVRRGLLKYDADAQPVPALASEYKASDDGLTYTFTLRSDLTFSNGDSLTSADVKRTFEYFADPDNGATYQRDFADIASIETPDDVTVVVTLEEPKTAFPQIVADPLSAIVPKEPLDETGSPVGAGPYMITEYNKGVSLTLEANPDFYNADEVGLERIEMTFMPDAQTRVKALTSGQVQFIDYVPPSDFETLEGADGVTLDYVPGLYGALLLNLTEGPLAEPKVRQALAYAIDRDALNEVGTLGYGVPGAGLPIPEDNEYFDEEQGSHFTHDPDKAKDLLAEAGHEDGFSVDILTTSQYFGFTERAQVVKSDLAKVGIEAKLSTGDYANLISKGNDGNYDLLISGPPAAMSDPAALTGAFLGGASFVRSAGIDESLYAGLLEQGAQTPNGDERADIYDELGEVYLQDVPFITTGQGATAFGYAEDVEGFEMLTGPLAYSSLYSFETVTLSD